MFRCIILCEKIITILNLWPNIVISGNPTSHSRVSPLMTEPIKHFFYVLFRLKFIAIAERRVNMFGRGSLFLSVLQKYQRMDENTARHEHELRNKCTKCRFRVCFLRLLTRVSLTSSPMLSLQSQSVKGFINKIFG